ncbi:MAG: RimK family alpha-L-glutamate ligase [Bacteroidia bacterium]|nr:RimK family alpha-L-glutamate ligase [Bacteroidia bacterium]
MNIAILSRNPQLYSTQSLFRACRRRGHYVRVIDHMRCQLAILNGSKYIQYQGEILKHIDAVIPRIGSSVTKPGAAVLRQFELQNILSAITTTGLLNARDKLRSLQILSSHKIETVDTIQPELNYRADKIIQLLGGLPVVVKLSEGTHGTGVMLADSKNGLITILETFHNLDQKVLVQKFIKEARGQDLRAIVVNGEVVASMKRKAQPGEFRSNLHRGGTAIHIKLDSSEQKAAIDAANALKLGVAGVDLLQSKNGPLVLEVNPSPGLEGIETITKVDVAGKIVEFLESKIDAHRTLADMIS